MTKNKSHVCSAISLFELRCRRLIENCRAKKYLAKKISSIWHISVNLHRILFNFFVLVVNLNLYCSSEALEARENRLYCVRLTSVNYGYCGFRARWSCIKLWWINSHMNGQFLLEYFLEARASFQIKITRQADGSPFLIRELTFQTTNKCHISYGKKKKNTVFPACKNLLSLYLSSGSYIHKWNPFDWYKNKYF